MRIDVLTLFPQMIEEPLKYSIIGRARENSMLNLQVHDIRDYSTDKHHTVDNTPYGGGSGMVMMLYGLSGMETRIIMRVTTRFYGGNLIE